MPSGWIWDSCWILDPSLYPREIAVTLWAMPKCILPSHSIVSHNSSWIIGGQRLGWRDCLLTPTKSKPFHYSDTIEGKQEIDAPYPCIHLRIRSNTKTYVFSFLKNSHSCLKTYPPIYHQRVMFPNKVRCTVSYEWDMKRVLLKFERRKSHMMCCLDFHLKYIQKINW